MSNVHCLFFLKMAFRKHVLDKWVHMSPFCMELLKSLNDLEKILGSWKIFKCHYLISTIQNACKIRSSSTMYVSLLVGCQLITYMYYVQILGYVWHVFSILLFQVCLHKKRTSNLWEWGVWDGSLHFKDVYSCVHRLGLATKQIQGKLVSRKMLSVANS